MSSIVGLPLTMTSAYIYIIYLGPNTTLSNLNFMVYNLAKKKNAIKLTYLGDKYS